MAETALPGQGSTVRAGFGEAVPVPQIPLGGAVAPATAVETALPEVPTEMVPVLPEVSVAENALPEEGTTVAPPGPTSESSLGGSLGSWQAVEAEPVGENASEFGGSTVASFMEVDYNTDEL